MFSCIAFLRGCFIHSFIERLQLYLDFGRQALHLFEILAERRGRQGNIVQRGLGFLDEFRHDDTQLGMRAGRCDEHAQHGALKQVVVLDQGADVFQVLLDLSVLPLDYDTQVLATEITGHLAGGALLWFCVFQSIFLLAIASSLLSEQ